MIEKRFLMGLCASWLLFTTLLSSESPADAKDFWQAKIPAIVGLIIESSGEKTTATGVWISNRFIMTAKHLVTSDYAPEPCPNFTRRAPIERILIFDGRPSTDQAAKLKLDADRLRGKIIEIPDVDIALLDILPNWSPVTLPIDTTFQPVAGRTIVRTYGFPLGDPGVPYAAKVVNRDVEARNYFALGGTLQAGYSGAPVLNGAGYVIGVDSCGVSGYEYIAKVTAAKNYLPGDLALSRGDISSGRNAYPPRMDDRAEQASAEPSKKEGQYYPPEPTLPPNLFLPLRRGTWIVLVASGIRTEYEVRSVVAKKSITFPDLGFHEGVIPDGRGNETFAVLLGTGLRQSDADALVKYAKQRKIAPDAYKLLQTFDAD
jgi:V8-like Glu-specific endopeptidase